MDKELQQILARELELIEKSAATFLPGDEVDAEMKALFRREGELIEGLKGDGEK
jgi:hypothetical protein